MHLLLRRSSIEPLWVMPAGAGVQLPCGAGRALRLAPRAATASCGATATHPAGGRRNAVDRAGCAPGRAPCSAVDGRCAASTPTGAYRRIGPLRRPGRPLHGRPAAIDGAVASAASLGALSRACGGWLTSVFTQGRAPPPARRHATGTSEADALKGGSTPLHSNSAILLPPP
jgi:hypothetical protein